MKNDTTSISIWRKMIPGKALAVFHKNFCLLRQNPPAERDSPWDFANFFGKKNGFAPAGFCFRNTVTLALRSAVLDRGKPAFPTGKIGKFSGNGPLETGVFHTFHRFIHRQERLWRYFLPVDITDFDGFRQTTHFFAIHVFAKGNFEGRKIMLDKVKFTAFLSVHPKNKEISRIFSKIF